jgi:Lipopolysaccharide-assembly/TAT (twin-arginine translocation) pathway signal sequence
MTNRRDFLRGAAALGSGFALTGCGYSLAGRGSFLPASIRVVGIPVFVNNTSLFEVEKRITDKVRSEFIGRGRYKVQPDANAVDALLTGEISSITVAPAAITEDRQASRYVITATTKIEFRDVKADKVLWANPYLQFRDDYELSNTDNVTDPTAFLGQDVNALDRLATELARTIVSAILEAF